MKPKHSEDEKLYAQVQDKKHSSADASVAVKDHLKKFLCQKLEKEGKLEPQESNDILRRFRSEPVLPNPRLESGHFKIKSNIHQSTLSHHKQLTPISDRRHPIRSPNQVRKQRHTVPPISLISFNPQSIQIPLPEQFVLNIPRTIHGYHSTGNLGENAQSTPLTTIITPENRQQINILDPKCFIVETDNEKLLTKELEQARLQHFHQSHSSIHNSQPHLFNFESKDTSVPNPSLSLERLALHSKSLSSISILSSPLTEKKSQTNLSNSTKMRCTTGLAYDDDTLKHQCYCQRTDIHLENPRRLLVIYERLKNFYLLDSCDIIHGYCATIDMLTDCHDPGHVHLFGCDQRQCSQQSLAILAERRKSIVQLPCGGFGIHDDIDTTWNDEYTARACRLAIGNTIELAKRVLDENLENGFALVRPPGHHATQKPLGFCYFNTVAITAKYLKKHRNLERIAIIDWDIHHGNGTQELTYDDPNILYLSLHRYDNGTYFPGSGQIEECGCDNARGKNVNIAFSGEPQSVMTDVEYLAAFRSVVMPILKEFQPQIILVSCGFDACIGHAHPLGGYKLTPTCFAYMTQTLMNLANGKIVLVLEGGYELNAMAECGTLCIEALLHRSIPMFSKEIVETKPNVYGIRTLEYVIKVQSKFWPSIEQHKHLVYISHRQATIL